MRRQSQTWDEAYHLLAGMRYWQAFDFGINAEHPPLVKWLAALPLVMDGARVPHVPAGTSKHEGFVAARQFLFSHAAERLLFESRLAASLFTFLLAGLVWEAARRMFGPGAGWAALVLAVFEPNLLAHGALVTTDAAEACCLFAAVYAFYRYAQRPSALLLLECGFAAGLALAAKHSGVLVFPILGLLALGDFLLALRISDDPSPIQDEKSPARIHLALKLGTALVAVGVLAIAVLWSTYAFRFRARPEGQSMTPPLAEYVQGVGTTPGIEKAWQRKALLALERWKLLPQAYIYGLADVLIVSRGPRPAFVLGRLYPSARWYYFPVTFAVKSTLGFLLLLLLVIPAQRLREFRNPRAILFLTVPPVLYMAVSLASGLDVGVRHILPIYPFLIILAGGVASALISARRAWAYVALLALGMHVASSLHAYPNYLAYSNEIWGGPSQTYLTVSDSNADWGQGLKELKAYTDRHKIRDCWLGYFGSADPAAYGIPCRMLPDIFSLWWGNHLDVVPRHYHGTTFVSATWLDGSYSGPGVLNPYSGFQHARPVANIGGSILVYQGEFDLTPLAALSRANHAWQLLAARRLDEGVLEARAAVELDPQVPYTHYTLGFLLSAKRETEGARREYTAALDLARSVHPHFQWFWVPFLEGYLKRL